MDDADRIVAAIGPVLADAGFRLHPRMDPGPGPWLLFHADGDDLDVVRERHPRWYERMAASYGGQEIVCLDVWVGRFVDDEERGRLTLEGDLSLHDLRRALGPEAVEALDAASGDLARWLPLLRAALVQAIPRLDAP